MKAVGYEVEEKSIYHDDHFLVFLYFHDGIEH